MHGTEYIISFGIGGVICTTALAVVYAGALVSLGHPLPRPHVRSVALPGLLSGVLWSGGNYCSIRATELLGLSVAWPLVQAQLVISSAWGLCYYSEVQGARWLNVTLAGVRL